MPLASPLPQALVIFGITGDLATKKILPALYNLELAGLLPQHYEVIGFSRSDWTDDDLREHARAAIEKYSRKPLREDVFGRLAETMTFVRGSYDDPVAMGRLAAQLSRCDRDGCREGRLFYLAVPPQAFATIVQNLAGVGAVTSRSRVVVEKPFGDSLESAKALTAKIHEVFDESQVFRIDHYLGKETVQNLVVFRFANALWERVWNRDAVDSVQLTVAETYGVEGRAAYYERAGAIRDLLQNHMLQVIAFAAMEPPRALEAEAFRDEKVKLMCAMRPLTPEDVVRGQYRGYRSEPGVATDSRTETFVAARLWIEDWRWEGVPFYLRHGKKLPRRTTELAVIFRRAPKFLFDELGIERLPANHLTIRIQPDEGISFAFQAKEPGPGYELRTVRMDMDYDRTFMDAPAEAYERLLHDAMDGDHTLFTREDAVDRAWEIVAPVLDLPDPPIAYDPGTWGPVEADALIDPRHWHTR